MSVQMKACLLLGTTPNYTTLIFTKTVSVSVYYYRFSCSHNFLDSRAVESKIKLEHKRCTGCHEMISTHFTFQHISHV